MSSILPRRTLGIAVVAFWLLMTALLLHRELGGFPRPAGTAPRPATPSELHLGLFRPARDGEAEVQVGEVHVRQTPEEREGLAGMRSEIEAGAAADLLGGFVDLALAGFIWRPLDAPRADFELRVQSGGRDVRLSGQLADGFLRGEVVADGGTVPLALPVAGDLVFASGFGPVLDLPALEVGEEVRVQSFDPLTLERSPLELRCVARGTREVGGETVAVRELEATLGAVSSRLWIDDRGEIVEAETPFGLVLRRLAGAPEPAP